MNITIYSFEVCPYCERAKALLTAMNHEYKEIVVSRDELQQLATKTGMQTVPQIFVGETLIGGFDQLQKSVESGEFQKLFN